MEKSVDKIVPRPPLLSLTVFLITVVNVIVGVDFFFFSFWFLGGFFALFGGLLFCFKCLSLM